MKQEITENQDTNGLTIQRKVVLEAVRVSHGHLTAREVYEVARNLLPTISYATVYNSLRYLKDGGLIGEITFGNGASRYDKEISRHDHAICSKCGELVDFDLPETLDLMASAEASTNFKPQSIHLTLVGLCPKCRAD
jgi:Fur family peroxide stress response transcriptional regulator